MTGCVMISLTFILHCGGFLPDFSSTFLAYEQRKIFNLESINAWSGLAITRRQALILGCHRILRRDREPRIRTRTHEVQC